MKDRIRRLEALALSAVMFFSCAPTRALAEDFDSNNVSVQTEFFGDSEEISSPEQSENSGEISSEQFYSGADEEWNEDIYQEENVQTDGSANDNANDNSSVPILYVEEEVDVSSAAMAELVEAAEENGKVDVVFVIDSTGSMSDEIAGVRNNLNKFTESLQTAGLNYQIAVMEYKDITESGEENSTKILEKDGAMWFNTASEVSSILSTIQASGGGDDPETALDAIGLMNSALEFRSDASKFAVLLTDAGFKNNNNYGYTGMSDAIAALKNKGVSMSVITSSSLQSTYSSLCSETDGISGNIYGNFAEELVKLASYVKSVVNPVTFKLSSKVENDPLIAGNVLCTLTAEVSASDDKNTAHNIKVKLKLPDGVELDEAELTKTIEALAPGQTKTLTWTISIPSPEEDTNYQWFVTADCDDFATGVICQARDTFSIAGKKATDYTFKFDEDNYSFLNSYDAFGHGPIYIDTSDLRAYLADLTNGEIMQTAEWYAQRENITNLFNGKLVDWGGSCYGMSLTAALFKVGILSPVTYGGTTTYQIPALEKTSNNSLESFINVYHISQASNVAMRSKLAKKGDSQFPVILSEMVEMADKIGKAGQKQMPYIVRLKNSDTGHAVVCYGIEYGDYSHWFTKYDKRLLIADPNSTKEEYIYITADNKNAYFSNDSSYNQFGYREANIAELNSHSLDDAMINYITKCCANAMTNYVIKENSGRTATIIDGQVTSDNGLNIESYLPDDAVADGESASKSPILLIQNAGASHSDFTITPQNGDDIDVTFYFEDYALSVEADADTAKFGSDGSINLENADGKVTLGVTLNDSAFDFVTIDGEADGDISIRQSGDSLIVEGNLSDFTVENMDREGDVSDFTVDGDKDVKVDMNSGEGDLSVKYDPDGEQNYDTPLEPHMHVYQVTYNWINDTSCTAEISCKNASCGLKKELECTVSHQVVSVSTCYSSGIEKYRATCEYEGQTYSDVHSYSIPKIPHTAVSIPAISATCTETGLTEGEKCSVCGQILKEQSIIPAKGHEWEEDYRVDKKAICGEDGSKSVHCKNCSEVKDITLIPATGEHKYGEYEIIKEATAVQTGEQIHTCSICGKIEKEEIAKIPATAKLSMTTIPLKVKQSTKAFKVTGLAKGDSVKSFKSSNRKIAVVDSKGYITAKSIGKARITVTLASGKKLTAIVKVQKDTVKTTKLSVSSKKVTIKKGKTYTVKPTVSPLTSQQKVSYQSSDNKIASVSRKGKITARKKGTAVISVKSGDKTVKIKVTVK